MRQCGVSERARDGWVSFRDVGSTAKQDYLSGRRAIRRPCDLFAAQLKERYGEPVFQTEAAELTVTLDLGGSDAIRRLVVPTFFTFAELHEVIQTVFCWRDYHRHKFVLSKTSMDAL